MKNKRHSYMIYNKLKEPGIITLLEKKMFVIVDHNHKPVYHRDGHLLIFSRARDGRSWLFNNKTQGSKEWRLLKLPISITKQ